jgi:4-hydroxybenzoate polyprenyltransferase
VKSVPARFGIPAALYASRVSHVICTALFVWYGLATDAGVFWWVGLTIVGVAFLYEHSILKPDDLSRLNRAFFTVNGLIGITLFLCALCDLVARGLGV